ncbi:MAG: conjugative transposon protein TraM [Prevotellaceae bacterium]|jgi:conjugative transposon TraM protein|nr:conjugative transposon protein TraM [Prevotellaceae bacterium]
MSTNNQTDDNKSKLTNEQKQKLKKYAVFAMMGIICAGCMWLIFAPSADDKAKQEQMSGFNADIPLPKEEGLIGDKRDAYEQEQMQQKQAERMRSLSDFTAMLGGESTEPADDLVLLDDEPQTVKASSGSGMRNRSQSSIQQSANAYHDINRTLGNFYESPKDYPEKELLKQELEELRLRMDEQESKKNAVDNQMALMEKSLQMAAKYMPGTTGTSTANAAEPVNVSGNGNASGKTTVAPVSQVRERTVSVLQPEMSGTEFIEAYSQPRNMGFLTATGKGQNETKNTLLACIHDDQTIMDGQSVRLRLLEAMQAGNMLIPRGTVLSGTAKIQGERLGITINFLEYRGTILPIELKVYDLDGMQGIFIPNLQELNAAKEIAANMGTSAGTSINLSNDAGEQFVADMGRNLIQGTSQFVAKKLREVKVHLKAGYRVYLLSEEQLKNKVLANNQ